MLENDSPMELFNDILEDYFDGTDDPEADEWGWVYVSEAAEFLIGTQLPTKVEFASAESSLVDDVQTKILNRYAEFESTSVDDYSALITTPNTSLYPEISWE